MKYLVIALLLTTIPVLAKASGCTAEVSVTLGKQLSSQTLQVEVRMEGYQRVFKTLDQSKTFSYDWTHNSDLKFESGPITVEVGTYEYVSFDPCIGEPDPVRTLEKFTYKGIDFYHYISKAQLESGCGWYEKVEIGKSLGRVRIKGNFNCPDINGECRFWPAGGDTTPYILHAYTKFPKVVSGEPVEVVVTGNELMTWQDCDGSDPTPTFEANATIHRFKYKNVMFEKLEAIEAPPRQ